MKKILLICLLFFFTITKAQNDADIAQKFGSRPGTNADVRSVKIQPDGKILIGGGFSRFFGMNVNSIIRLNEDGTNDTSFNSGLGFSGTVLSIALQSDGKILVGGLFSSYNGLTENNIIRLNPDGTKDTSFITGSGFNETVKNIEVQLDGKILIGGYFNTYNGIYGKTIVRLNTDGSRDISFSTGNGFDNAVNEIKLQPDGKILVGGHFFLYNGEVKRGLIRLNINGTIDNSFNTGLGFWTSTGSTGGVQSLIIMPNGKILVFGNFFKYNNVIENGIVCLNSDGTKDTTFTTGTGFIGTVIDAALQPDGKIIVGGNIGSYNGVVQNNIIRLNSNGTKDTNFTTGTGFNGGIYVISLQTDGKIIIGGGFGTYNEVVESSITRLHINGIKDLNFSSETGFDFWVYTVKRQVDGKIICGGEFTTYKGIAENRIIRFNTDGTKDTSFVTGIGFKGSFTDIRSIAIQPDGKILLGGNFVSYNGLEAYCIVRLNTDGTKDTSFNTIIGGYGSVDAIELQPDGKIILGGSFYSDGGIVRLHSDGTQDNSFNKGTGFNGLVYSLTQQSDGKILVGGTYNTYNGLTANRIIRLNPDGTKDTSFTTGTGFNSNVSEIKVQPDGKILVGGFFTSYNGISDNRIIRLNNDGTKDINFLTGSGFSSAILDMAIQSDNKILIGGQFSTYNSVTQNGFVRLNPDGTKDVNFNTGTGFNTSVSAILLQPNGEILLGGAFSIYNNNQDSAFFIKLKGNSVLSNNDFSNSSNLFSVWPNPAKELLNINLFENNSLFNVKIHNVIGKLLIQGSNKIIDISDLPTGLYIINIQTEKGKFSRKFIKN